MLDATEGGVTGSSDLPDVRVGRQNFGLLQACQTFLTAELPLQPPTCGYLNDTISSSWPFLSLHLS